MAEPSDELQPGNDEDEGGAVKSFLEHLEDLRWTLIKSAAATLIGMMVCLFTLPQLYSILKWPLKRAQHRHIAFLPDDTNTVVQLRLGGALLQSIDLTNNHLGALDFGTNHHVTVELEPVIVGSNTFLSMRVLPPGPEAETESGGPTLVFMGPSASFISAMHLALFGGLILASPFVLFFVGQFVMPALKRIEKKYFMRAFWVGLGLFLSGVLFAFIAIMPAAIKFAVQFSRLLGISSDIWRAEDFFGFEVKFMLGMGLGFELPVVLLALVKIGILDYAKLKAMRRYMIVGNLILGALLTTPEVLTQVVMAVALQVLYEAAVWTAWWWERQEKKRQAQAGPIDV